METAFPIIVGCGLAVIFVTTCVDAWVSRAIAAYDRRTKTLMEATVSRINAEHRLFYEDLKERRRPTPTGETP